MKRRIYSLFADVETAQAVHQQLLLSRIAESQMHFWADEKTDLHDLPRASLLQTSDIIHGLQIGLIYGGMTGVFAGMASVPVLGVALQTAGVIVLAMAVAGALVGAWSASMVAISVPNHKLKRFESAIATGGILLMLDVSKESVAEVSAAIKEKNPQANVLGVEPTIPAFP